MGGEGNWDGIVEGPVAAILPCYGLIKFDPDMSMLKKPWYHYRFEIIGNQSSAGSMLDLLSWLLGSERDILHVVSGL